MGTQSLPKACVQYSGGTDSTYVAYLASLEFEKVHLISFYHSYMFAESKKKNKIVAIEKLKLSFDILTKKFPGKFQLVYIDIDDLLRQIANRQHFRNLIKYRTINMFFGCFKCQACFHVKTIAYCLKNNIYHVSDGANTEYGEISPMQIKIVMDEIDKLYKEYGITHTSPIYYEHGEKRSDHLLYELGLRPERNIKGDEKTYTKYQGYCKLGACGGVGQQLWKRSKGYPEIIQTKIKEHWIEEVPFIKSLIDNELKSDLKYEIL